MIITLLSLLVFILWSRVAWKDLNRLRQERIASQLGWYGDLRQAARNRQTLILFGDWAIALALFFASIQYVDIAELEWARWAGNGGRVMLLIVAILILRMPRDKR